jgi:hypothetical protein
MTMTKSGFSSPSPYSARSWMSFESTAIETFPV